MSENEQNDTAEKESEGSLLVATFALGDGTFGVNTEHVQEVVKNGDITPVHHAPPHIIGIRNLRGKIVTVIDLRTRLDLGTVTESPSTRIIIVEHGTESIGLMVDSIADTLTIDKSEIEPPPSNIHGVQGRSFIGVYRSAERVVAILDLSVVFKVDSDVDSTDQNGATE